MLIKWNEINSVNVKEIDEQHKKLVDIINEFFSIDEKDQGQLIVILDKLSDYANYHLNFEEKYFAELAYDKSDEHVESHNAYRKRINGLQENLQDATGENIKKTIDELSNFLRDWWINHINKVDHQYSEWFNSKGVY